MIFNLFICFFLSVLKRKTVTFDSDSCLSRLSMDSSFDETPFSSSVLFLT